MLLSEDAWRGRRIQGEWICGCTGSYYSDSSTSTLLATKNSILEISLFGYRRIEETKIEDTKMGFYLHFHLLCGWGFYEA
jgi:hypothetical protein